MPHLKISPHQRGELEALAYYAEEEYYRQNDLYGQDPIERFRERLTQASPDDNTGAVCETTD